MGRASAGPASVLTSSFGDSTQPILAGPASRPV